ncbi:PASTA domain-containing protein [Butyrivibrio sp. MC2013]|uniref:PASTA domain-containing protein n=1 Tax=Butyrivibrio sp. MC2013 TaxID=1280686 RepID=UPI0004189236|nr:PASTA domain-containing protein [Butyrivibrio sp. MC2013]
MPDVVSSNLKDALETLKKAGFSSIDTMTDNDGYIWDNSDWEVVSQSVQAGEKENE